MSFTSLFSTKVIFAGLPRKAFPGKQAKVDTGHQCFSVVAQATPQDSHKARPRAILEWKNLIEQLNLWSQHAPICAITCQHCPTVQFVSWAETDSLCGRVMMAWIWHVWINAMVIVFMAQAPPKPDAKRIVIRHSKKYLKMIHEFASVFSNTLIYASLPRKAFPQK